MARILAFIPDLLFGSNVAGALTSAGYEVELASSPEHALSADALIVDLTADPAERIEQVTHLGSGRPKTLAFFSHVEPAVRDQAQAAGFELVVPRSRMNREGATLLEGLLADE